MSLISLIEYLKHAVGGAEGFPIILGVFAIIFGLVQTFYRFSRDLFRWRVVKLNIEAKKQELTDEIASSTGVEKNQIREITARIERKLREADEIQKSWVSAFGATRDRVSDEISSLRSSARSHLLYGLAFCLFSLSALGVFAFYQDSSRIEQFLGKEVFYRMGFALLLQAVGFFFLRLYVRNHTDIKYYNNELTNLDMKEAGLRIAFENKKLSLAKPLMSLIHTERNFILKKGESSIFDDNREYLDGYADKLSAVIKTVSKSK
jgi:hypothetical protein